MVLLVAIWVLWNAFHNLKETMKVFLQATPSGLELLHIEKAMKEFSQVEDIHHAHLWSMDGLHHILTTHVIVPTGSSLVENHQLKIEIKAKLFELFHIQEGTIEIEWAGQKCSDPDHFGPLHKKASF